MICKNFLIVDDRNHFLSIAKDKRESDDLVHRTNAILLLDKGWELHKDLRTADNFLIIKNQDFRVLN